MGSSLVNKILIRFGIAVGVQIVMVCVHSGWSRNHYGHVFECPCRSIDPQLDSLVTGASAR